MLNVCLGTLFAWSVFLAPIEKEFAASRGEVSAVFSWSLVIFAMAVVLAGRLIGRLWSGAIAAIAAACTAAGLLVASTASTLAMLAVGYVGLVGGANGLGYLTAVDVASREFDRRRGLATGLVVGAYAGGPLLAGPVAGVLLPELGWRGVMVVLAVVLGSVMLGAAGTGGNAVEHRHRLRGTGCHACEPGRGGGPGAAGHRLRRAVGVGPRSHG